MAPRVLIVDDNPEIRALLRAYVEMLGLELAGEAFDGAEAVDKVQLLQPDIVVMDLMMPVLHGLEATSRIKQRWPDVEVVGYTSAGGHRAHEEMISAGARASFDKEDVGGLMNELDQLVREMNAARGP